MSRGGAAWLAAAEDYGSLPQTPSVPVEEQRQPAAEPPLAHPRRRKLGGAALLVAFGGLAGLVASKQVLRPRASESEVKEEAPANLGSAHLMYYKHARLSLDPKTECAWLTMTLGLDAKFANYSEQTARGPHICAEVCEATTLNGVALSDSKSWGTNAGAMRPADWIEYWLSLHGRLGGDADASWSQFMHLSVAFWAPSLSGVVHALVDNGVNHIKRTYRSEADGRDMFIVMFANPFTGQLIEVHAPSVHASIESEFDELDADSCPGAIKLAFSNDQMGTWWESSGGSTHNARGYVDMILVRVSQPSSDLASIKVFADSFTKRPDETNLLGVSLPWTVTLHRGSEEAQPLAAGASATRNATSLAQTCAFTSSVFSDTRSYGLVEMRTVENPLASVGQYSVADWEVYIKETHGKFIGSNAGWDRYMDMRHGISIKDTSVLLDDVKTLLDSDGEPFRGFLTTASAAPISMEPEGADGTAGDGSADVDVQTAAATSNELSEGMVFTSGFDGIAVEMKGYLSTSGFNATLTTYETCAGSDTDL